MIKYIFFSLFVGMWTSDSLNSVNAQLKLGLLKYFVFLQTSLYLFLKMIPTILAANSKTKKPANFGIHAIFF